MKKSGILAGAAAIIAGIHQLDLSRYINTTPCIQRFLARWREGAMEIHANSKSNRERWSDLINRFIGPFFFLSL